MKFTPIVYCRTRAVDYRKLVVPDPQFCPGVKVELFFDFIRTVLKKDNPLYGKFENIRWAYFKLDHFILWGAAFQNHLLEIDEVYQRDEQGRAVRSFTGLVLEAKKAQKEFLQLPYSEEFLQALFDQNVIPSWESRRSDSRVGAVQVITRQLDSVITHELIGPEINMNTDKNMMRLFPGVTSKEKDFFSQALNTDVAFLQLVSGINENHALGEKFMNSIVSGINSIKNLEVKDFNKKKIERSEGISKKSSRYGDLTISRPSMEIKESKNSSLFDQFIESMNRMNPFSSQRSESTEELITDESIFDKKDNITNEQSPLNKGKSFDSGRSFTNNMEVDETEESFAAIFFPEDEKTSSPKDKVESKAPHQNTSEELTSSELEPDHSTEPSSSYRSSDKNSSINEEGKASDSPKNEEKILIVHGSLDLEEEDLETKVIKVLDEVKRMIKMGEIREHDIHEIYDQLKKFPDPTKFDN